MESKSILSETGIIITIILVLIPLVVASIIIILKAFAAFKNVIKRKELEKFNTYLKRLSPEEALELEQRQKELEFNLKNNELAGDNPPQDSKGLISNVSEIATLRFIEQKKRSQPRPNIEPDLTKMILWYIGCAIVWLLFGTTVGDDGIGILCGTKSKQCADIQHKDWLLDTRPDKCISSTWKYMPDGRN